MGILAACLLPEAKSGQIWGPVQFSKDGPAVGDDVATFLGGLAQEPFAAGKRLWDASERATDTKFVFGAKRCDPRGPFWEPMKAWFM